jgi:glycerate kinase
MSHQSFTVLIAPDKFKGTLSALEVCQAINRGIKRYNKDIITILHPLADGGEGSVNLLSHYLPLEAVEVEVENPVGKKRMATYYKTSHQAFIELAEASGLELLTEEERNPMFTSSYGSGQMILDAIQNGATEIFLFLGGSATNDAAIGIARALGYRFFDKNGNALPPTGENLSKIHQIDSSGVEVDLSKIKFTSLCDVNNTLFGKNGAAYVYAPQKGASHEEVVALDTGLRHFADLIKQEFNLTIGDIPGGGAAGGIGAGLIAFCNAELKSGIQTIMEVSKFPEHLRSANLVFSGEGKIDQQTLEGKVINGVTRLSENFDKPVALFAGQNKLSSKEEQSLNTLSILSILDNAKNMEDAMKNGAQILEHLTYTFMNQNYPKLISSSS